MTTPILYEDNDWLAVDKPTGLSTHGVRPGDIGLVEWLALHGDYKLHIFSRLDKGTSGVVLFARRPDASKQAQKIHEQDEAVKTYLFISKKSYQVHEKSEKEWQNNEPLDGKACLTRFRLIEKRNGFFLYEAVIHRGRTHQIRRHAALSGVPVLGDDEYGGERFPRLCLHCHKVEWPLISGPVVSPQPDSFCQVLEGTGVLIQDGAVALERRGLLPGMMTNSYRLVQRGELSLPVSIDIYDRYLSVAGFSEEQDSTELKTALQPLLDYLEKKLKIRGGLIRQHVRNPHRKKLVHDVLSWGETLPEQIIAKEHGLFYGVHINDSQHVGLFLDQRDSRRHVQQFARGRRVANLFSFTCSFSAAAVCGGAEVVFSVDLAGSSLGRGKENFAINNLTETGRGKFIKEDVVKWLKRQEKKQQQDPSGFTYWDLIICDPPVFASAGKGQGFHVEKQWAELARQIRLILSKRGVALFANNHRGGKSSYYQKELEKQFRKVTPHSPPLDFPKLPGQPDHVRIFWCEV